MGYELNKLMQQYGVSTPGRVAYSGPAAPVLPSAPTEPSYDEDDGAIRNAAKKVAYELAKQQYQQYSTDPNAWAASAEGQKFNEAMRKYGLAQKEYDAYSRAYQDRLAGTPMYAAAQFRTGMPGEPVAPAYAEKVAAPTYGNVPTTLAEKPAADLFSFYDRLYGLGYTDAEIRAAAEKSFGPITDASWGVYSSRYPSALPLKVQPAATYGNLSATSSPTDIAKSYATFIGSPSADTQANRTTALNYLSTLGVPQETINQAYNTYLTSQPTPLYTSLTGTSSPTDVARAYAQYTAGSGGDTAANQTAAMQYLQNLGLSDQLINQAYNTYKTGTYSHGGVHKMAQKYKVGGQVRRYRLGGDEGEPVVSEEELPMMMTNATAPAAPPVTRSPAAQPVTPPASAPTPVSPAAADLTALMNRYLSTESTYGPELTAARRKLDTESKAFESLVANAMKGDATTPDKTEMYFRLAAAFGSPSKTGRFTENLALAGKEMSEYAKDVRAAKKAERQLGLQLGLEAQKLKMQGAREDLSTLRTLAGEEMKDKRAVLQEYIKSGRPQSEAGKAAIDAGFVQGTPEFTAFVEKYIDDKIRSGNMLKEAMVAIAGSRESRAAASANKLTAPELKLKSETEDRLTTIDNALKDLSRAYDLNKDSFDTTLKDRATLTLLEQTGSKDPKVINTKELMNLLKSAMISSASEKLKGVLSDSDIKLLQSVAGLDAKSREERAQILKNAYRALKSGRVTQQKRLNEISQGLYRETTPAPATGEVENE